MKISKKKDYIVCILFGAYIAAVLWITLFSRIGEGYRRFLLPFHSYVEVLKGNKAFLLENVGNVVLFIPLGVALSVVNKWDVKKAAIAGLLASLLIEVLQFTFALGTFECDDLIHNTLGAVIGAWGAGKIGLRVSLGSRMRRVVLLSMVLCSMVPFGYREVRHQKMMRYAAIYDREDGAKNLLVLNGKNRFSWNTGVRITFLDDGSIHIKGTSDRRSWWPVGEVTLEPGVYSFFYLSGTEMINVGMYLEAENTRISQNIEKNNKVVFSLSNTTRVKAYVVTYPECDCDVVATPVIYKEG